MFYFHQVTYLEWISNDFILISQKLNLMFESNDAIAAIKNRC